MKPDPVALLEKLVAIPSLTGSEAALACFCEAFLQRHGFACERQYLSGEPQSGRFNLLARRGEASEPLLLYAHLDTVAPDPAWEGDPFRLRAVGDRLVGLGASDMKGGLAVILAAAATSTAPLRIALGVDEEAWSAGAWELVHSDWCNELGAILVPELTIDSENEVLGIGRRGHAGYRIVTCGPRQHGAVPLREPSAIARASRLALCLETLPLAEDQLGREALVLRAIEARSFDLTVPERCSLELSWLSLPGRSPADFAAALADLLAAEDALLEALPRPTPVPLAYALDPSHPLIAQVQAQARACLGLPLELSFGLSVADENVLASLGLPVLSLAPVGGHSHRAGEWVSAASLARTTGLYRGLIDGWPVDSSPITR
ncbi:MAG TPA: M20/M25/M40 family metallo-hydrolase [Candidatus Obscuribacterales bacterium]